MHKVFLILFLAAFASGAAFAHEGKSHRLLGTVKSLQDNHLTVTDQDGHEARVMLTETTQIEKEGKPAKRADLAPGVRVFVQIGEDDKSAVKVRISTVTPAAAPAQVIDPVCGMKIDPKTAAASSAYEGKTYWFCSKDEKVKFDKDPAAYVKKGS